MSEDKQVTLAKGYAIPAGGQLLITFGEGELPIASGIFNRKLARKQYELKDDHLGRCGTAICGR